MNAKERRNEQIQKLKKTHTPPKKPAPYSWQITESGVEFDIDFIEKLEGALAELRDLTPAEDLGKPRRDWDFLAKWVDDEKIKILAETQIELQAALAALVEGQEEGDPNEIS